MTFFSKILILAVQIKSRKSKNQVNIFRIISGVY